MSEIDSSQESLLENLSDDSTINSLWRTFRAFEHEVVRASEACSICSDLGFEGHLRPDTQSQEGLYLKESFAKLVHRSMYCWFCRFLCRIVACDCRLKETFFYQLILQLLQPHLQ
jgi:hypothetical protein